METTTEPTRATMKAHGNPRSLLWFGSVANRGEGIPATARYDATARMYYIEDERGGLLDLFPPTSKLWAVPLSA